MAWGFLTVPRAKGPQWKYGDRRILCELARMILRKSYIGLGVGGGGHAMSAV